MKKVIALLTVLVLCAALVVPAFAANEFTPSVNNKPAPDVVPGTTPDGKTYIAELLDDVKETVDYVWEGDIVVTPISQVDTSEKIPEAARDTMKDVYVKLSSGEMTIPYEQIYGSEMENKNMVIRDLFDVSFPSTSCHEYLEPDNTFMRVTFDLGVAANQTVYATLYKNGEWVSAEECKNNGDGTVTIVVEDFCPVAFSVEVESDKPVTPPQTGDQAGDNLYIWIIVAAVSLLAVVVLSVVYFKGNKKAN